MRHVPRFYVNCELKEDGPVVLTAAQMHHAANVLRLKIGDTVRVFNEKSGEWHCEIYDVKKCSLGCVSLFKERRTDEDGPILACCLINPNRMPILLEKVTELGVSEIIPVISQYTQYKHFNYDKTMQTIIGACEQSGRISVPKLANIVKLEDFLEKYPYDCKLLIADEGFSEKKSGKNTIPKEKCAFFVGPEGGFSDSERDLFNKYDFIERISLGNNILRSETAAIALAAMALLT